METTRSRDRILELLLKSEEPLSVQSLSASLGISRNAAHQQVIALEREGLIERDAAIRTRGRPSQGYRLSEAGNATFQRQYALLARQLLEELSRYLGPDELRQAMTRIGGSLADNLRSGIEPEIAPDAQTDRQPDARPGLSSRRRSTAPARPRSKHIIASFTTSPWPTRRSARSTWRCCDPFRARTSSTGGAWPAASAPAASLSSRSDRSPRSFGGGRYTAGLAPGLGFGRLRLLAFGRLGRGGDDLEVRGIVLDPDLDLAAVDQLAEQ